MKKKGELQLQKRHDGNDANAVCADARMFPHVFSHATFDEPVELFNWMEGMSRFFLVSHICKKLSREDAAKRSVCSFQSMQVMSLVWDRNSVLRSLFRSLV